MILPGKKQRAFIRTLVTLLVMGLGLASFFRVSPLGASEITFSDQGEQALARGIAAAGIGDWNLAYRYFKAAHDDAPQNPDGLYNLALVLDKMGGRDLEALAYYRAFLAAAPDAENREQVEARLFQMDVKIESDAGKIFGMALKAAGEIPDASQKDYALSGIAKNQAKAGDFDGAFLTINMISSNYTREDTLKEVSVQQARFGLVDAALATANRISTDSKKGWALRDIVVVLLERGEGEKALNLARRISDYRNRIDALANVARDKEKNGDKIGAGAVLDEAAGYVFQIKEDYNRNPSLATLIYGYEDIGDFNNALSYFNRISANSSDKDTVAETLVRNLLDAGRVGDATRIANSMTEQYGYQERALQNIQYFYRNQVQQKIKAGDLDGVEDLILKGNEKAKNYSDLGLKYLTRGDERKAREVFSLLDQFLATLPQYERPSWQNGIYGFGEAYSKTKDPLYKKRTLSLIDQAIIKEKNLNWDYSKAGFFRTIGYTLINLDLPEKAEEIGRQFSKWDYDKENLFEAIGKAYLKREDYSAVERIIGAFPANNYKVDNLLKPVLAFYLGKGQVAAALKLSVALPQKLDSYYFYTVFQQALEKTDYKAIMDWALKLPGLSREKALQALSIAVADTEIKINLAEQIQDPETRSNSFSSILTTLIHNKELDRAKALFPNLTREKDRDTYYLTLTNFFINPLPVKNLEKAYENALAISNPEIRLGWLKNILFAEHASFQTPYKETPAWPLIWTDFGAKYPEDRKFDFLTEFCSTLCTGLDGMALNNEILELAEQMPRPRPDLSSSYNKDEKLARQYLATGNFARANQVLDEVFAGFALEGKPLFTNLQATFFQMGFYQKGLEELQFVSSKSTVFEGYIGALAGLEILAPYEAKEKISLTALEYMIKNIRYFSGNQQLQGGAEILLQYGDWTTIQNFLGSYDDESESASASKWSILSALITSALKSETRKFARPLILEAEGFLRRQALKWEKFDQTRLASLSGFYAEMGELDKAETLLAKETYTGSRVSGYKKLADIYALQGNRAKEIWALQEGVKDIDLVEGDHDKKENIKAYSLAYSRLGDDRSVSRLLALAPNNSFRLSILYSLAPETAAMGDLAKGETFYLEYLNLAKVSPERFEEYLNYWRADQTFQKDLALAKTYLARIPDSNLAPIVNNRIYLYLVDQGRFQEARDYLIPGQVFLAGGKGLEMVKRYLSENQPEKAWETISYMEEGSDKFISIVWIALYQAYHGRNTEALQAAKSLPDLVSLGFVQLEIARIAIFLGNTSEARLVLATTLPLALKVGDPGTRVNLLNQISKMQAEMGDEMAGTTRQFGLEAADQVTTAYQKPLVNAWLQNLTPQLPDENGSSSNNPANYRKVEEVKAWLKFIDANLKADVFSNFDFYLQDLRAKDPSQMVSGISKAALDRILMARKIGEEAQKWAGMKNPR